ncbi:RuvB-like protein 2 [Tanacetum coccineum]
MPQRVLYLPILESHLHMVVVLIWKVTIVLTILPHLHSDSPLKVGNSHTIYNESPNSAVLPNEDSSQAGTSSLLHSKRIWQNPHPRLPLGVENAFLAATYVNNVNSTSSTIEDSSRVGIPASTPRKRTHQNAMARSNERVSGDMSGVDKFEAAKRKLHEQYQQAENDLKRLLEVNCPDRELLKRSDAVHCVTLHEIDVINSQVKRVQPGKPYIKAHAVVPFTSGKMTGLIYDEAHHDLPRCIYKDLPGRASCADRIFLEDMCLQTRQKDAKAILKR